jgi:predicted nucleotidyltransferase
LGLDVDRPDRGRYSDGMSGAMTAGSARDRLADIGNECPEVRLIVLFGSVALGRARADSDVDIGVVCDRAADLDALYVALAPRLQTGRLDLVDLTHAGPLLAFQVARSGLLLFERELGEFRRFQSLASRRYADTKKLRDAQRRAIQAFLERGRPA